MLHKLTASGSSGYSFSAASTLTTSPSGQTLSCNSNDEPCWQGTGSATCTSPPTGATTYTWESVTKLPLMLADGTNAYLLGPSDTPVDQINLASSTASYLLSDDLGSVRDVTNNSGTLTGSTTYDPWGNVKATTGSSTRPFGFAGSYKDSASGFDYFRARWYDAGAGQFTSLDPDVAATLSPFGYVEGDPVNGTDPDGENPQWLDKAHSCGLVVVALSRACPNSPQGSPGDENWPTKDATEPNPQTNKQPNNSMLKDVVEGASAIGVGVLTSL